MNTRELRRLLSEARLPASVDVAHVEDGEGYGLHDSATGEPLPFSWARAEAVMALLNAAPALLDVVEAAKHLVAEWDADDDDDDSTRIEDAARDLRRALEALHGK